MPSSYGLICFFAAMMCAISSLYMKGLTDHALCFVVLSGFGVG